MTDEVGRAGFHARHTKAVGERVPLLHEMMRHLDPAAVQYWAALNPSIVVADEPLNVALVNDGAGGVRPCSDAAEVIAYGERRLAKVGRKPKEDRWDEKKKKWVGGTITTTAIVCHLPKSMCVEVPDFYPRTHKNGKPMLDPVTGEQMRRSRWVARDRDEALRYFADVREFLTRNVVPGGADALLGEDIQFSESTPHDQFLFDAFAPDPKKPGQLRAAASDAYYSSRNVLDADGKQKSGRQKFRDYHADLKSFLIGRGYDISPDFDELRHMSGEGKADYERLEDERVYAERMKAAAEKERADVDVQWSEIEAQVDETNAQFDAERTRLNGIVQHVTAAQAELKQRAAEVESERAKVHEARAQALAEIDRATLARQQAADALRRAEEAERALRDDREVWELQKAEEDARVDAARRRAIEAYESVVTTAESTKLHSIITTADHTAMASGIKLKGPAPTAPRPTIRTRGPGG